MNCVLPSVIDTPANRAWMSPDLAARAVAPAAIAKVIAFLIGPDAAPISGAGSRSTATTDAPRRSPAAASLSAAVGGGGPSGRLGYAATATPITLPSDQ